MNIKTLKDIGTYKAGDTITVSKKLEFISPENISSIRVYTDKNEEISFAKGEYETVTAKVEAL